MRQQLARARYQDFMHLNSQVIEEMQWWHGEMHQWSGITDASSHSWGGWWRPFGPSSKLHHEAQGFWLSSEEGTSSNARELSGVKLTIKAGLEHFRDRVVLADTDNKVLRLISIIWVADLHFQTRLLGISGRCAIRHKSSLSRSIAIKYQLNKSDVLMIKNEVTNQIK